MADSSERESKRIPAGHRGARVERWIYTSRVMTAGVTTAYTYSVRTNIEAGPIKIPPQDGFTLCERALHLPYPFDREREIENAREGRAGEPMHNNCDSLSGGRCWSAYPSTVLGPDWALIELLATEPGSVVGHVAFGRHEKGCLAVPKGLGVVTARFERTEAFWAFLEAEHARMLTYYRPLDSAFARCPHCDGCGAIPVVAAPPGDAG